MKCLLAILVFTAAALALVACGGGAARPPATGQTPTAGAGAETFLLRSSAFEPAGAIPFRYTCDGEDISPPLSWSGVPRDAASFALIMDDQDAGGFSHWVLFNLPSPLESLPEGLPKSERLENGGAQGRNDFDRIGYGGPCPPAGKPHRYRFVLYALDVTLDLGPGATKDQVLDATKGHVLGQGELVGIYQRMER